MSGLWEWPDDLPPRQSQQLASFANIGGQPVVALVATTIPPDEHERHMYLHFQLSFQAAVALHGDDRKAALGRLRDVITRAYEAEA